MNEYLELGRLGQPANPVIDRLADFRHHFATAKRKDIIRRPRSTMPGRKKCTSLRDAKSTKSIFDTELESTQQDERLPLHAWIRSGASGMETYKEKSKDT